VRRAHGKARRLFQALLLAAPLDTPALCIVGLGVHERMAPSVIRRPRGTGDYLFMMFHDQPGPDAGRSLASRTRRKR